MDINILSNKFENLGTKKYIFMFNLMCPKTKEKLYNLYKLNKKPFPKYLNYSPIEHFYINNSKKYKLLILLMLILLALGHLILI